MCCPCNHCGKCTERLGRCIVCYEKLPEMFSSVCPRCGAPQPPAPGKKLEIRVGAKNIE